MFNSLGQKDAQLRIKQAVINVGLKLGIKKIDHLEFISIELTAEVTEVLTQTTEKSIQDKPLGEGRPKKCPENLAEELAE